MARIPLLDPNDPATPPAARTALQAMRSPRGDGPINLFRALANHPAALETFSAFLRAVYARGTLSRKQAELAYTTATVLNQCFY
ncbi:MAG TPA: carboxymuconolactone decarboxylase family protein [Dehalococcoidia bacterium]|nr:carboxymuconolactone decarboxylase family protein [Dehalococcoidia bacterium]